jgi:hypothetical protein
MKAVDFIRKFGWNNSIGVVVNCEKYHPVYQLPADDLRKYTDAYELVQSYGGLDALELHLHSLPVNYESVKHFYEALSLVEEVGV